MVQKDFKGILDMDFGIFNFHIWSVVSITFFIYTFLIYLPQKKIKQQESKVKRNEKKQT